jgi:hypothetical protein
MKYAFIMGSNSYIVPGNTVVYNDHGKNIEFLRINSVYQEGATSNQPNLLSVDLDIKDVDGSVIKIQGNKPVQAGKADVAEYHDRLLLTRPDGTTIIDVHQLDNRSAKHLEHNIIAELEVHAPVAVVRVRGNFMAGDLHVEIDNEKLFLNKNSYANSTLSGKINLEFANEAVVL